MALYEVLVLSSIAKMGYNTAKKGVRRRHVELAPEDGWEGESCRVGEAKRNPPPTGYGISLTPFT